VAQLVQQTITYLEYRLQIKLAQWAHQCSCMKNNIFAKIYSKTMMEYVGVALIFMVLWVDITIRTCFCMKNKLQFRPKNEPKKEP